MTATGSPIVKLESDLLADVSVDLGWQLIERFAELKRESGMPDEHAAAQYIVDQLKRLGVEYVVYEPELYLSLPRKSSVVVPGAHAKEYRAKPPAFAVPTDSGGFTAEAVYLGTPAIEDIDELFETRQDSTDEAARGKIVVTDGYAMPGSVQRFERAGAVGQIYVNPGKNIHWGICTPIWGMPTDENLDQKPETPVVAVNQADGEELKALLSDGNRDLTLRVSLEEGWYKCKIPVATIRGESDDFLLVHGHYDSWDVGIGDNAVGDATLLELARIFHAHREGLRRTLKVAWWPGHSMGRYAGSTWYADEFGLELRKRCVATVNIDSPGCWKASAYEDVMWMAEANELCLGAIKDRTGLDAGRRRPIRAGDYSFNQVGLTSFFMLLSNIPQETRDELGFYPVGGCGGNIAWHTEDDQLDVADRRYLEQDLSVYVTAIARVLNAGVLPFDYRNAVRELADAIGDYERQAKGLVDLSSIKEELIGLQGTLDDLYRTIDSDLSDSERDSVNELLKELARLLVPLNYARGSRFQHDPALSLGTVPKLEGITRLETCSKNTPDMLPFLQAGLRRYINEVADVLYTARQMVVRYI
ncbi:MAG: M28 family peptidase [Gemmatimonadales bacterium]